MGCVRYHPFCKTVMGLKEVMGMKMTQPSLKSVQVYGVTQHKVPRGGEDEAFVGAKLELGLGR